MVDPAVVHEKFDRQVEQLCMNRPALRRDRGLIIEEVRFPSLFVIFGLPFKHLMVATFGVELNFTDYNLYPPSARFFEPLSRRSLKYEEMLPALQKVKNQVQNVLIDSHPGTKLPFMCLRGFREYHEHPQHTNDPWEQYRHDTMIGTAHYCLEQIWLRCLKGAQLAFQVQVQVARTEVEVSVE